MSRSGRIPIEIPDSTNVTLSEGYIVAKGKLGELKFKLDNLKFRKGKLRLKNDSLQFRKKKKILRNGNSS